MADYIYEYKDAAAERNAALWLCSVNTLELYDKHRLLCLYGCAENVMKKAVNKSFDDCISTRVKDCAYESANNFRSEKILEELWKIGAEFFWREDAEFPERLKLINDPPLGIFVIGSLPDPEAPAIAVVGARACSSYGVEMCERFASGLSAGGVQIISGMALGIDGISHKACIKAGGKTFAVMGSGIGMIYPVENSDIYHSILSHGGGIISEYYIGCKGLKQHFPERNRLISGLADGVLVVEARKKSGTMITVNRSLEQGKDVFVIPGRLTDALSEGCNELIKKGAQLVSSVDDIAFALKDRFPEHIAYYKDRDSQYSFGRLADMKEKPVFNSTEQRLLDIIRQDPIYFDELMGKAGMDYFELMEILDGLIDKKAIKEKDGIYNIETKF